MKLSKRLRQIIAFVPHDAIPLDLGSDHGLIPLALIREGLVKRVFASDISLKCVAKIKKNTENYQDQVIAYQAAGLDSLPKDVNCLIMAGMGSFLMINILKAHRTSLSQFQTIIIDSHAEVPLIREYLNDNGFMIEDERGIIENSHFYEIIKFVPGKGTYDTDDVLIGPFIKNDAMYLRNMVQRLEGNLETLSLKMVPKNVIQDLKDKIRRYQKYASKRTN
ncbi:MAG: class I SAM-dependent methyltransferase [Erysipelotrichaceae bacterium]|nr:class I SAM-dependent methyltransferase [Erysipelotrichaceae bacterium]